MTFVSLFSERFMVNDASQKVRDYTDKLTMMTASRMAFSSIDSLQIVLNHIALEADVLGGKNEYYILVFDGKDSLVGTYNSVDEDFVSSLGKDIISNGGRVIRNGSDMYVAYSRSMYLRTSGAKVCTIVVYSPVDRYNMDSAMLVLFLMGIAFATIFAVVLAVLLSRNLTRNLKRLTVQANKLANREFDGNVVIESNDEIGQLAQAVNEMAESIEEYDKSQKVFLQNASHELRTPLMCIRGYVEGIKDGVFTDVDSVSESILSETARMEKLIEQLIYLSKIETAKDFSHMEPVSVPEIIREASSRVLGISAANGIDIIMENIDECSVNADGDQIVTVFTNILSNCLRYAKHRIDIDVLSESSEVCIMITDDGNGFCEEDIPYLFERFYKGKTGKHGLGLAIAKAIVVSHKGSIQAYNRTDGTPGAVFEVRLPKIKN